MKSHGHSLLGPIKDRPWMTLVLKKNSCYHISKVMVWMSQLLSLPCILIRGPRYVAKGYVERLSGVPGRPR